MKQMTQMNQRIASSLVATSLSLLIIVGSCVTDNRKDAAISNTNDDLERAFWSCDYASTTRWVGADEGATCVSIFEEVKRTKFDGDFGAMLAWWKENKIGEHRLLAKGSERR